MKILILDGNSILNRAFYGIRSLSTKDGIFTNGIYGFLNILLKLKEQVGPDKIFAAFDLKAPTFRKQLYEQYKAGRKPQPEELTMQFPILKEILALWGVTVLEKEGYEADDFLGTVARLCRENDHRCFIATGDRDSLQLVGQNTTVLLAATKAGQPELRIYDPEKISDDYGVTPEQLIDVKGLMGDQSDNIPGVAGVGEKTALSLISKFGSIDGVYENIDSPEIKAGVRQKLLKDKDNAYLSKKLGTICCEVPCDINFEPVHPDLGGLRRKLASLELFRIIKRIGLENGSGDTSDKSAETREIEVQISKEAPDIKDTNTFFPVPFLAENELHAAIKADGKVKIFKGPAAESLLSSSAPAVVHNLKFLYEQGIYIKNPAFDTYLCGYLLNPSASDYSADRLCEEYSVKGFGLKNCPKEFETAAKTAALLPELYEVLRLRLSDDKQKALLKDIEMPLSLVLSNMEKRGFLVDAEGIRAFGQSLTGRIAELEKSVYEAVGYEFNLNSPKQLADALFIKLGLPAKKKTKSGFSTNAEVLEELRDHHPVGALLEYRQLAKLKSTYVEGLLAVISDDGRIHSTFNQTETRTGRISSSEPNLQNIPVRKELGRELRRFFAAKEGCVLVDADYSQIELRVLAHMANDRHMIDTFLSGGDIHTSTAAKVFGVSENEVTSLMRSRAKAVNFGIVYGIGAFSLSKDLKISFGEAKSYIKNYMDTYSGVADYMEKTVEKAKNDGFVETLFGRRRPLPELSATSAVTRSFGERVARNMPVQGTAADIIKIAMINVEKALEKAGVSARLILQIHDELIVEAPESEAQKAAEILKREMEHAVELSAPLTVDCHTGRTWFDAKE